MPNTKLLIFLVLSLAILLLAVVFAPEEGDLTPEPEELQEETVDPLWGL